MTKQQNDVLHTTIQLSQKTMLIARKRAQSLGLTVSAYIESVLKDTFKDPWSEPLPDKVVEMYKRDYDEFVKEEKKHPQKPMYTAAEFIKRLHDEIRTSGKKKAH